MADADAIRGAGVPDRIEPPSGPAPEVVEDRSVMSLVDHLTELRSRLVKSILAVLAGSAVGLYIAPQVRRILIEPLPVDQVQTLGPGDAFAITLRIAIVVGIILGMPVILYQVWAFVAPGLTAEERRAIRPWIPFALVFFALGVGIAYLILPFAINFLLQFTDQYVVANFAAGPYFDFVTTMFLVFGLVLEFPILLFGLSRVGILTSERLRTSRRMVILAIAIFAALATPGGDVVSPLALGGTMYLLYELTVVAIRRSGR
jgi:sec-independent protein translocase protein TatC